MAISSHPSSLSLLFFSPKTISPKTLLSSFTLKLFFSSHQNPNSKTPPPSPWLHEWPSPNPKPYPNSHSQNAPPPLTINTHKPHSAIDRIVHRLRDLGLGSDDDNDDDDDAEQRIHDGEDKFSDLLNRSWVRSDTIATGGGDGGPMPWERGGDDGEEEGKGLRKKRAKAPTLAELVIEDSELKRLRRLGMEMRERLSVPKAGVTQAVLEKIHQAWRKSELVRLRFHEDLAHNMKMAHQILERRTGGLVIWKSGSVMVVYRGSNYEPSSSKSQPSSNSPGILHDNDASFPNVSPAENLVSEDGRHAISSTEEMATASIAGLLPAGSWTEEEAEYNSLLDGLGPRFVDWWGTGSLPVDADLLPTHIPGYKTPFRLLPTGMRPRLSNAEMTSLRKFAKSLPCHFALAVILKLWEKSIIVKIAIKPGIQNTNNKLMAEEIKNLTGGILLLRNKYFIVMYRGKDFVPTSVAAVLAERQELAKDIQAIEEKARIAPAHPTNVTAAFNERQELTEDRQDLEEKAHGIAVEVARTGVVEGRALAGTLAESLEAQKRWGREITPHDHQKMKEAAAKAKTTKMVKEIEHKLALAQAKKLRAERLLAKIEASMVPGGPCDDQESITNEERFMFRRVGLRMKAYLPLGIRGVFDGVIENMHLHWKHRELVKLISKQKTLSFVEDTARLLEYESGGILVAIERVPKGYALIFYRGKNYRRPISLRPRNLLTKAKALKRSVAMQRHEALSQHISELESTIEKLKLELVGDNTSENQQCLQL
ncbi:hypothetical protein MRB53_018353 [Persea americana]|uniref:Uncharacterized protein n=1 Tax=Persea americana TaxID=3435 RepID=A0ACC2M7S6_PERAE|nr:hypothetical protein MRB53_018353 [Persea americana]